ncbi:hypothetical protein [Paenibacillus sp. BC26]|uniref:hypothetical protein n=1 Tax=Paenibacillus sp. BC26 TaxID=1881032 RepID=UPI0008E566D9|nr:hypothetical protein [Paenibacillus sp. BC26]SFS76299.1 hypothetical protein SAMN05428962_2710 [Paenibacillus sp. BC26]
MRFRMLRSGSGCMHFFLMFCLFLSLSFYKDLFRVQSKWLAMGIATIVFVGIWGVGVRLWNLIHPYYLTLEDSGMKIGTAHYQIHEIESLSISKLNYRTIIISLRRHSIEIDITLWKSERPRIADALKLWANNHGISYYEYS